MFSIVIPLYNKELSITDTIQSVLNQTYQNFEIVIVNDGSTDRSVEVVESIKDSRIRLIHQENKGVSAARNKGIQEAKFDWIAFLDGDDLWKDFHLATFHDLISRYTDQFFFVSGFEYSIPRKMNINRPEVEDYVIQNYFKECLSEHLIWTGVVVINKKCFENDLFNETLTVGEDLDLWARLSKKFEIVKSNKATALYRVEAENRSDVGKVNFKKNFIRDIELSKIDSLDEKKYYKKILYTRLKQHLRAKEWSNVCYLLKKLI